VERGLVVRDPDELLRRRIIQRLMCDFRVDFSHLSAEDQLSEGNERTGIAETIDGPQRFAAEWADLQALEADGLLQLEPNGFRVSTEGRWLIRTIAAVFDPRQRLRASGSRLI
jgi:oxygen-independent coproporphyrinogen III oxidase